MEGKYMKMLIESLVTAFVAAIVYLPLTWAFGIVDGMQVAIGATLVFFAVMFCINLAFSKLRNQGDKT